MERNNRYITCKKTYFYSQLDEAIFFEWIQKIPCIKKSESAGDELYLDLVDRELNYEDLKDLIALSYRYKIKMSQLKPLITEKNKAAAAPWIKQINKKNAGARSS